MENFNVYHDIQQRTGGNIYIGVVGPVRTGKSTFIKRFMELLVLPAIEEEPLKSQTRDELPQSAAGRTIMTTEPKFIPKEAVQIVLDEAQQVKVRLIDCVGFVVEAASGYIEDEKERMVKTPWFDYEIPFTKAAEIGTQKVIRDHSTIGVAVTSDGSFGELNHDDFVKAEEQTVQELKQIGKPFVILLNSTKPYSEETKKLAGEIQKKYDTAVCPVNCEQLKREDIVEILKTVLLEFPVVQINFYMPHWLELLSSDHWLKSQIISLAGSIVRKIFKMRDMNPDILNAIPEIIDALKLQTMELENGNMNLQIMLDDHYYYRVLSEWVGIPVENEYQMIQLLSQMARMKEEYEKVGGALETVRASGYGVVIPDRNEMILEEPQIVRHGSRYGVKMKAKAPSIHLIKAQIETEIAPIVGNEQQAKDLIEYIKGNTNQEGAGIWDANIFGKSVEQIVEDGIHVKIAQMTDDCQQKLQDTLQKIINDSNGGMICIII